MNRTKYALLTLLGERPMSAYELHKQIEQRLSHFWSESFGQIYPVLKRMTADGLVVRRRRTRFGRTHRVYELTTSGEAELLKWMAAPVRYETPRNELFLRLHLASQIAPDRIASILQEFRERNLANIQRLQQILMSARESGSQEMHRALLEHDLALAEKSVAWCDFMLDRITCRDQTTTSSPAPMHHS